MVKPDADHSAADTPLPGVVASDAEKLAVSDAARRASEIRYRRLFESAQDGILILNAETGQIDDVNPFLISMLGYSHAEFLGKKLWEIGAFKDAALNKDAFVELQRTRFIRYDDLPLESASGRRISVEFVSNVYDCDGVDVIQCNIRDNTLRHLAESALRATVRALKMTSESNFALVNSSSESTLLAEYCRIAVETGGYRMAWIGFADDGPGKRVIPMAFSGHDDGYLGQARFTWDEAALGGGPTGRAIRKGEIQFSADIAGDPAMAPWRAEALKRGYLSSIALPFKHSGGAIACLTIYGGTRGTLPDAERALLNELTMDASFGLSAIRTAIAKSEYQARLGVSLEQTIQVLAATIEQRDPYTAGHQSRVANLCSAIAGDLGLSRDRIHGIRLAASIHDLGKIGNPAEILAKPKRLTDMEFGLVKEHVDIGFQILKDVAFPWPIATIVRQHHERLDGSGYPQGLRADAILLESRILAVADVVEAMASHRPYRRALGIEAALAEISARRETAFDAEVVDACLRQFREKGYEMEA